MGQFELTAPSLDNYWRAIILFGRNVASYKFALGQSLLELARQGRSFIPLDELAEPFSMQIVEHLKLCPTQTTSQSSRFLEACKQFSTGKIEKAQLIERTENLGFNNVIDAFHVVNRGEIPVRFFVDKRNEGQSGIELTDQLFRLKETLQFGSLGTEIESRWRLVETAWELKLPSRMLVGYDSVTEMLTLANRDLRRCDVTASRGALNGYQKGRCFYCFDEISVAATKAEA